MRSQSFLCCVGVENAFFGCWVGGGVFCVSIAKNPSKPRVSSVAHHSLTFHLSSRFNPCTRLKVLLHQLRPPKNLSVRRKKWTFLLVGTGFVATCVIRLCRMQEYESNCPPWTPPHAGSRPTPLHTPTRYPPRPSYPFLVLFCVECESTVPPPPPLHTPTVRPQLPTHTHTFASTCVIRLCRMQESNCPLTYEREPFFPGTSSNMTPHPPEYEDCADFENKDQLEVICEVVGA